MANKAGRITMLSGVLPKAALQQSMKRFYAGGFIHDPVTDSVLLHRRDEKTAINPNKGAFFGGLNEGNETPVATFVREFHEETDIQLEKDQVRQLCNYLLNEDINTWRYVFYTEASQKELAIHLTEGAGYDWVPLMSVFHYDLTEKTRHDLQLFFQTRIQ